MRSDLLYRLSVIPVELPALRARGDDVDLLAQLFLDQLNMDSGTAKAFSGESRKFLHDYAWPGNVRELKNLVQRTFLMADSTLELSAARAMSDAVLAAPVAAVAASAAPLASGHIVVQTSPAESERSLICAHTGVAATRVRGGSPSLKTLYNRLHEYGTNFVRQQMPGRQFDA